MDCGVPFCHQGCPLGNLIPDWNDLVYRDAWRAAIERLHQTNNFPEFTGLLCPAPCEGACVLGINKDPVTIKVDRAGDRRPGVRRGLDRAGAAGDADLEEGRRGRVGTGGPRRRGRSSNRAGHSVTVFEKADRIGGLLRYGIPEFKMEKRVLDRRLALLAAEGVVFRAGVRRRRGPVTADDLRRNFDAVLLAGGAGRPRDLAGAGTRAARRALRDGLPRRSRTAAAQGDAVPEAAAISAAGKHVVIIGGGDTGADCLGTVHRQGAASVAQLELHAGAARARAPPTTRGRSGRRSSAPRRRTKRAAIATTRSPTTQLHRRR